MQIKKKITRIKFNFINNPKNLSSKVEMFKFVPFLMNNFVDFLQVHNFEAEEYYLQQILQKKPLNERYYSIIDLIIIFNDQQLKNLRLLWKLFLRKSISQMIIDQIQSKRMQILYQRKVNLYISKFYKEQGAYRKYVERQVQAEGPTKERYEELQSKINNNQIIFSDYPVNQQKFEEKIKVLLQQYINEDTNTITHPQNFIAIIDIITYLHEIEGFSIHVLFNGSLRKTFLSICNLKKYLSGQNQIQKQQK